MSWKGSIDVRGGLLKIAGIKLRRSEGPPYSRFSAKREAKRFVASDSPTKWDSFHANVESPQFVKAIQRDKILPEKLKLHAYAMHHLTVGETVANVEGSSGKPYDIRALPGGSLGCTCRDWKFRGSVDPGYKCKHLRAHEAGKDKVSMDFADSIAAWASESDRIAQSKRRSADEQGQEDSGGVPSSSVLSQDEDLSYRSPRPAPSIDEPELIVGGNG